MKNNIITSFLISLGINIAGFIANYLSFRNNNWLLLSLKSHGGEITVESGFGAIVSHIYSMRPEGTTSHNFRFSIIMFLLSVTAIALVVLLVLTVIHKLTGKKA